MNRTLSRTLGPRRHATSGVPRAGAARASGRASTRPSGARWILPSVVLMPASDFRGTAARKLQLLDAQHPRPHGEDAGQLGDAESARRAPAWAAGRRTDRGTLRRGVRGDRLMTGTLVVHRFGLQTGTRVRALDARLHHLRVLPVLQRVQRARRAGLVLQPASLHQPAALGGRWPASSCCRQSLYTGPRGRRSARRR